jgi:hypothetical protein
LPVGKNVVHKAKWIKAIQWQSKRKGFNMSKRFSILLVVLVIVSGLIGGIISGRIFAPKVAIAEETTQNKVLTVEELRVVDKDGRLLMNLGQSDKEPFVNCYGLFIYNNSGDVGVNIHVRPRMGGRVLVYSEDDSAEVGSAIVQVYGKDSGAMMNADKSGGSISVYAKDNEGMARMSANKSSSAVNVYGKGLEGGIAGMSADESGGSVDVHANLTGNRAMISSKESSCYFSIHGKNGSKSSISGSGAISLRNNDGKELKLKP